MKGRKRNAHERAYNRRWAQALRARWRSEGLCIACGLPTGRNYATGKPFVRCLQHRLAATTNTLAWMRRKAQRKEQAA